MSFNPYWKDSCNQKASHCLLIALSFPIPLSLSSLILTHTSIQSCGWRRRASKSSKSKYPFSLLRHLFRSLSLSFLTCLWWRFWCLIWNFCSFLSSSPQCSGSFRGLALFLLFFLFLFLNVMVTNSSIYHVSTCEQSCSISNVTLFDAWIVRFVARFSISQTIF